MAGKTHQTVDTNIRPSPIAFNLQKFRFFYIQNIIWLSLINNVMVCLLISNHNGLESEWTETRMETWNQNKLFILAVGIEIGMNCIVINVFTIF